MVRSTSLIVSGSAIFILAGCAGVRPSASISDPSVFTSAHIAAVPAALKGAGASGPTDPRMGAVPFGTIADELMRKFRQEAASEQNGESHRPRALVMDEQLDQTQQIRSLAQFLAQRLSLQLTAGTLGAGGTSQAKLPPSNEKAKATKAPSEPKDDNPKPTDDAAGGGGGKTEEGSPKSSAESPSSAPAPQGLTHFDQATIAAIEQIFTAGIQDSPFDRLDRAVDYYTAFLLKVLPGVGWDTRLLDRSRLGTEAQAGNIRPSPPSPDDLSRSVDQVSALRKRLTDASQLATEAARLVEESKNTHQQASEALIRAEAQRDALGLSDTSQRDVALERNRSAEERCEEAKKLVDAAATRSESALKDLGTAREAESQAKSELEQAERQLKALINPLPATPGGGVPNIDESSVDRLILLTFQTHIHAGSEPNTMTGVRIRIVDAGTSAPSLIESRWAGSQGPDLVDVIRLHPTRSYDVESQAFLEVANRIAEVALSGPATVSGVPANGALDRSSEEESRERRQFLSRLTKAASFANAPRHEFGWNFYPTNLTTTRRTLLQQIADWATFQSRSPIQVQAFLEGGARDCAAWMIVPKHLEWIDLEVSYVVAALDPVSLDRKEERFVWCDGENGVHAKRVIEGQTSSKRMRVRLPKWDKSEALAFWDGRPTVPPAAGGEGHRH